MVDVAESYEKMSQTERERFEREHFDQLPENDKSRVANQALSSGQIENHSVATYLDRAYGNGDGEFNGEDLKMIAAKREDTAFNEGMVQAGETIFTAATVSTGLGAWAGAPASFQLGQGGALGSMFNPMGLNIASNEGPQIGVGPEHSHSGGLLQNIGTAIGIKFS